MQKNIFIIKPYGSNSTSFLEYLENETGHKLFCVEKLEEDFKGVMIFCRFKNDLKAFQNKNNEYVIDFLLEEKTDLLKLRKEIKNFISNKKNILSFKFLLKQNLFSLKISTKYNYKVWDFAKEILSNFNEIKKMESAIRTKNCGIKLEKSISIDDLWMFSKNVILLNGYKNNISGVQNLIIGEFDLIHKGHEKLLKEKNTSILTFTNNPNKKLPIFNDNYKINQLKKLRPKQIFVYDIFKNNISAKKFIEIYLIKINPKKIIVGSDFKFGTNAKGDINLLRKYFDVEVIEKNDDYSTSKIKDLIIKNNFNSVNKKLYNDFLFEGIIVKGKQLGRKLGFPTANIIMESKFPFENGSYYSNAIIDNKIFDAMSFILTMENNNILVETFIFNFNENIYGKKIKIMPLSFIRKKQKFKNIDTLIAAIKKDESKAKELIKNSNK